MNRTLLITNDFPPRAGGIQSFVYELARRMPSDELVVLASTEPGAAEFDAAQQFPVIRYPRYPMLPIRSVRQLATRLVAEFDCRTVWFGAMAPLGALAGPLRAAGIQRAVAMTHGHEVGWAALPGARTQLRRIGTQLDVVTYLGEYTRRRLAPVLADRTELVWLPPGVDVAHYRPDVSGAAVRERYRLGDRPVVGCVSRLVPRKGQDTLIKALPHIRRRVPDVVLLIVGNGRYERSLRRLARHSGVSDAVVFTGSVASAELPAHYAAGDVFAMPCRTRRWGLDVEGLGIVYLEASACGLPVIAGDSGGAPDAVKDGETGFVVNGRDVAAVAERTIELLDNSALAASFGKSGRLWVESEWHADRLAARMRDLLEAR